MKEWVPFYTKLVWPVFFTIAIFFTYDEVSRVVSASVNRIEAGGGFKTPWFELGQSAANTEISTLASSNLPIEALGGGSGVVRKSSENALRILQQQIEADPNRSIDTLLLTDGTQFSPDLIRRYVGTLGLRYVVFQQAGGFDGWMMASTLVAQLPDRDAVEVITYDNLKASLRGIRNVTVRSETSVTDVLSQMQTLHMEVLPVVDDDRWLFFANRGEILSQMIAGLVVGGAGALAD